jgi:preprotein translocase subunit SecA
MIGKMMAAVFGSRQERDIKRVRPLVGQIHQHEERLKALSEAELKGQTELFRTRLKERTGALARELEEVGAAKHSCADPVERDRLEERYHELEVSYKKELAAGLNELLPEAFAVVREACRRLLGTTVTVFCW